MNAKRAQQQYRRLSLLAQGGQYAPAEASLRALLAGTKLEPKLEARCRNDLGVLAAARGDLVVAREQFARARELDPNNAVAAGNLARIGASSQVASGPAPAAQSRPRIALVSLLFNWPSSGGGCMHTVGLGKTLAADGYEVKHFFAQSAALGIGKVEGDPPLEAEALTCAGAEWRCETVKARFREAVHRFAPDLVLVTDAWSFKPHLVEAMRGYPTLVRFDGQECLCPLNNARFLVGPDGTYSHCPFHQLATPEVCQQCLQERAHQSGELHRAERSLSEVERPEYQETLRRALWEATAVLVNNPLFAAMLSPYAPRLRVVPPGIDQSRFPWEDAGGPERAPGEPVRLFMAGVVEEPFKGFEVLHQAGAQLWRRRQDFRLLVTAERAGRISEYCESVGWLSQETLPGQYRAADLCVVPSLVQDAWPNVASEAMAAGRPVVASRIGGLQFLVGDGATGLLFAPGKAEELAACLERLLDDAALRRGLGRRGRERFLHTCSWEAVLARHYRPLLAELLGHRTAVRPAGVRTG